MDDQFDDGGPAFPVTGYAATNGHTSPADVCGMGFGGMSLRDYYAGGVMVGLLSSSEPSESLDVPHYASFSYEIADAMLKAREI